MLNIKHIQTIKKSKKKHEKYNFILQIKKKTVYLHIEINQNTNTEQRRNR